MPKIELELKKAILELPNAEKDKLLLKLIGKDDLLVAQLYFKLIENSETTTIRRDEIEQEILSQTNKKVGHFDLLATHLKKLYVEIQWHQKVTKDKYGEVHLLVTMLKNTLEVNEKCYIYNYPYNRVICNFIFQKTKILIRLVQKLDTEYWLDFENSINFILEKIKNNDVRFMDQQEILPYKFEF